ncbi:MAG: Gfo/Idh/MocA family oxidoreductase [Oceanipulchritudo sp.]
MKKETGIGFVGAGNNTRLRHLPGFAEIPGVKLVTVANRSEASGRAVAEAFGIPEVAGSWEDVVHHPEVDAVCIGTWPYLHAEVTTAALAAGKHVLTEARMAADLAGAQAMVEASREHPERVAQIVPSPFTLDLDRTVMELIGSGSIGAIREIFIEHAHGGLVDPEVPLGWRQDRRYSGVNMLTMGIYHEVIVRWFADPVTLLGAVGRTWVKERVHWETGRRTPVELPDSLHIHARLGEEVLLNYYFSGVETGPERNQIRLNGSSGSLRVDVGSNTLYRTGDDGTEAEVEVPQEARRGWQVEADFIGSIREGKPVELTSFRDGLRYMAFTEAVFSHIQGQ